MTVDQDAGSTADEDDGQGTVHVPVLVREVLEALDLRQGLVVVDGTVGAGGHGKHIAKALGPEGQFVGLDRDSEILACARAALISCPGVRARVSLHPVMYSRMEGQLAELGLMCCDRVFLDLGVNSMQIDSPERGFSYRSDGPLDMRMDRQSGQDLGTWLARVSEAELATVLHEYGEERYSRRIARAIVKARQRGGIHRTLQLAEVIRQAVPGSRRQRQKIHPARRSFQALRIQLNDELGELERGLPAALASLREGGRLVVITFHSLEDRIVKRFMREHMRLPFRKPVVPSPEECGQNPRARSAKLRCGIKRSGRAA